MKCLFGQSIIEMPKLQTQSQDTERLENLQTITESNISIVLLFPSDALCFRQEENTTRILRFTTLLGLTRHEKRQKNEDRYEVSLSRVNDISHIVKIIGCNMSLSQN